MHLFIIESFISIDMLSPVINVLKKKKILICNINLIQDHKKNKIINFFVKKNVQYCNFLPLDKSKLFYFVLIKILISLPCFFQIRLRSLFKKFIFQYFLSSEHKIEKFLIDKKVKSITYVEDAPIIYISNIYKIAKKLKIPVIKIPSGLYPGTNIYKLDNYSDKLKFCDKIILPNKLLKTSIKNLGTKIEYFGSLRYSQEWFNFYKTKFERKSFSRKKIVLGFFKKYQSSEDNLINQLIDKLEDTKKYTILTKEKPRDVFSIKCNKYDNDEYSSSELIDNSDIIISSRPSSILVEAIIKEKKVILLLYANKFIKDSQYYPSKAITFVKEKKFLLKKINLKQSMYYQKNRIKFLNKSLIDWQNYKKLKKKYLNFYNII